ncbi:MAG: formylglycine-generating enzyme family protein [Bacteriovoracales bacterium]|nr:formylglycine-generating enzyme family protein [Bacteriovoracales bacterium]
MVCKSIMAIKAHLKNLSMLLIFGLLAMGNARRAEDCSKLLKHRDGTDRLKNFLGTLMERQVIGDEGLSRLTQGLESGELVNPITEAESEVSIRAVTHRKTLQRYVDGKEGEIDQKELLAWSKDALKKRKRVRVERTEVREETEDIYEKITFYPVKGGSFLTGNKPSRLEKLFQKDDRTPVHLPHTIEVMSTPVTQKQWVDIMEENPSHFKKGLGSIKVKVDGKLVTMRPDNPVEQVSWSSALVFANRLSEAHGLRPVYDLSKAKWRHGQDRAENGDLEMGDGTIGVNAPRGNYYKAQGFRLPTQEEQEYLLRAGGKEEGKYAFGDNENDLKEYAWYAENADGQTHPVGKRRPIIIDGHKFYDLHGNVKEWAWVLCDRAFANMCRPAMGGSFLNFPHDLRSSNYDRLNPGRPFRIGRGSYGIGFRLVRTIHHP